MQNHVFEVGEAPLSASRTCFKRRKKNHLQINEAVNAGGLWKMILLPEVSMHLLL